MHPSAKKCVIWAVCLFVLGGLALAWDHRPVHAHLRPDGPERPGWIGGAEHGARRGAVVPVSHGCRTDRRVGGDPGTVHGPGSGRGAHPGQLSAAGGARAPGEPDTPQLVSGREPSRKVTTRGST